MSATSRLALPDRTLWPAAVLLAAAFAVFEYTNVDLWVQDHLFNFATRQWLVDGKAAGPRLWFYNGPKIAIIALGLGILALAVLPEKRRARLPLAAVPRRCLWVAFFTIGLVPALIGQLKATTNTFCPSEIRRYGGDVPYVRVVECYPENDRPARKGRCFPAGHSSGGFALMALAGFARTRRGWILGVAAGLAVGWWMGGYQMAKGSHYLSHTVVTMFMAWIGFLLLRRLFRVHRLPVV